jgi:phage host-nuclease inhibitor protein Gam
MIRSLFKIGLLLVVGILGYNYFFGTDPEKENSKKVFHEVGDVARSVGGLLRSERDKFNQGKYDNALEKLGGAYQGLKKQAKFLDENVVKRLDAAEKRREALKKELDNIEETPAETPAPKGKIDKKQTEINAAKAADTKAKQEKLLKQLEDLQKEFEDLATEAGK